MDRNTPVIITRMGNGFQVRAEGKEVDDILVFESKVNMLKAVDKHFSDERKKRERKEGGE